MEEKINELVNQINTLMEKVSNIEKNSVSKSVLNEEIKPIIKEISSNKVAMISKNDMKIKLRTIAGKDIELYTKRLDKIYGIKTKIKEKENISESQQFNFLGEKLLSDDSTLSDYNKK